MLSGKGGPVQKIDYHMHQITFKEAAKWWAAFPFVLIVVLVLSYGLTQAYDKLTGIVCKSNAEVTNGTNQQYEFRED